MATRLMVPGALLALSFGTVHAQAPSKTVQPGAPGEATRVLQPGEMAEMEFPEYNQADVRFMQGMIPHHQQALDMAALVADRTSNPTLLSLSRRIDISQKDEIGLMTRWLEVRGESAQVSHTHHGGAGEEDLMPGMLSADQMEQLAAAKEGEFDRLFLELMIGHHEGALTMVEELFASPGGGQDSSVHRYVADVDADQQMEILRMRKMLDEGM